MLQGSKGMEEGSGGSRTSSVRSHQGRAADQNQGVAAAHQGPGHPAWPSTSPTNTVKNRKDSKAGGGAAASKPKQGQSKPTAKANKQTNPTNNLPDLTLSTTESSAQKTEANPDKKDNIASLGPHSNLPQEAVPQAFQAASQTQEVGAKPTTSQIEPSCQPEPPPSLVSDCGDSGISASNDSQYYAKMTIIDDMDSLNNSISEDPEEEELYEGVEGGRTKYTRSISEPPREATLSLAATPVRKLSECEPRSNQLTGLFFQVAPFYFGPLNIFLTLSSLQRLLASDEGEGAQYRSTSSLASQESKDSGR